MDEMLVACRMMEDEIQLAIQKTGRPIQTEWIDRQLHIVPKLLRTAVQEIVDRCPGRITLLLALAQCGNALVGLQSRQARLVIPRFADCLHLLRSMQPGNEGALDSRTLYLTKGWLQGERTTLNEYRRFEAKHGTEKANKIYQKIIGQYRQVCMVETGAYDLEEASVRGRETAKVLGLAYGTIPGTTRVLEKLLSGRWDEEFIVLSPGRRLCEEDFSDGRSS